MIVMTGLLKKLLRIKNSYLKVKTVQSDCVLSDLFIHVVYVPLT